MIASKMMSSLRRFALDARGNIAMVFGIAAVPLIIGVGAAVEYSRGADLRTRVTSAADAAVLAGVIAAQSTLQNASLNVAASATSAQAKIDGADAAQKYFDGATASLQAIKSLKATPSVEIVGQTVTVSMSFKGQAPMMFGALFNKKSLEFANTVTASSGAGGGQFLDVHVVMDNSASMGVGATLADINAMLADPNMYPPTPAGCAFACHIGSEYGYSFATDDYAKTMGYTLRIDVLKTAVQAMLTQANSKKSSADQFQFSLYTFANRLTALGAASTDYAALAVAVNGVSLTRTDGGTNFSYTLGTELAAKIPATSGAGTGPSDRKTVVIIVTDGTENSLDKFHSDGAFTATSPATVVDWKSTNTWGHFLDANFTPFPSWSYTASSGSKSTATYYDGGDFHIQAMNPAICDKLKNKGAAVGVLYVTPSAPASGYTGEKSDIFSFITTEIQAGASSTLEKCASSSNYYASANSPTEISAAMTQLFQKFTGGATARLTK